ncbi:hypothetical protein, partial [Methylacidiphilum caldifontis]|uniref:hypothetical protein n=1 Tax=Methylacidiphilum caldifontis TaxID=2795386 RepID=UPI001ABC35A6
SCGGAPTFIVRQYTRAAVDATLKTGQRRSFGEAKPKDGYALRAILPRPKRRGKPAHLVKLVNPLASPWFRSMYFKDLINFC